MSAFGTLQAPATNGHCEGNLKVPFFLGFVAQWITCPTAIPCSPDMEKSLLSKAALVVGAAVSLSALTWLVSADRRRSQEFGRSLLLLGLVFASGGVPLWSTIEVILLLQLRIGLNKRLVSHRVSVNQTVGRTD